MSEPPTPVKEERASPGPDSPASVVREDITIKVEPKMEWENPPQSFNSFANISNEKEPAATVKKEIELEALGGPSGSSQPQNMEVIDNGAISEHFLAFSSVNKHNCQICFKSFANNANLQRHNIIHTRIKLECKICGKQYVGQELLDKHMVNHNKVYSCKDCGKVFKNSSNLMQHKRVHMTVKPHQCNICKKTFSIRSNLLRHQTRTKCSASTEMLTCKICNKEFQKYFLLKSHLRKHDTDRPYQCDLCQLAFKYKSAIIRHMQWHSGSRPYKCEYCSKTFTHSGLIKPHIRIHTGEKPYKCSICSKLFTHKHNMERHKINHGRIKRLVCDLCNKKFPRESRLKYHMKTHISEKFFDCGKCDKQFTHKSNVIRHYERKHPGFKYNGKETDASVAMRVWDQVKDLLRPHYDIYQQPEEILG